MAFYLLKTVMETQLVCVCVCAGAATGFNTSALRLPRLAGKHFAKALPLERHDWMLLCPCFSIGQVNNWSTVLLLGCETS